MARCGGRNVVLLLQFIWLWTAFASPRGIIEPRNAAFTTAPTATPNALKSNTRRELELKNRQAGDSLVTCGYLNGDEKRPRSAAPGFNCRVDTQRGLWGFCPTSVMVASDCGLAGNCIDKHSCSRGCGLVGTPGITTFTCGSQEFCSTAILSLGTDADFSYIACGREAITETYLLSPTRAADTTTGPSETSLSTSESAEPTLVASKSLNDAALDASQPTKTGDRESNTTQKSDTGAIIGGTIGGLALICITAVATVYLLRRSRANKHDTTSPKTGENISPLMSSTPGVIPPKIETGPSELPTGPYAARSELPG